MRSDAVSGIIDDLGREGIDAYLCRDVSDLRWATGMRGVFDSERAHLLIVSAKGLWMHTDGRYSAALRANEARDGLEISDEKGSHARFAAGRLKGAYGKRTLVIGVEESIPLNEYRALESALSEEGVAYELAPMRSPMASRRARKDDEEVELLRRAQAITDEAFAQLVEWMRPGVSEKRVASELEYRMRNLGADGLAFPSIVASGAHSAMPHAVPSDKPLEAGDLVVIDCGARFCDYCADMTRTVAVGQVDDELLRMYDAVLDAHEKAKAAVRPGASRRELHGIADAAIARAGYEGRFTHSLGHGVGIDVHEQPTLSPRAEGELEEGNVVTVEPGVYVPGLGGVRIEDFGVVVQGGFDDFTGASHELVSVG